MEIDYAVAWHFVDADGRRLQLRFRPDAASHVDTGTFGIFGQLIAADVNDSSDEVAISRPNVPQTDVDTAIDGWQEWATLLTRGSRRWISLTKIRRRIEAAGLGPIDSPLCHRTIGAA